MPESISDILTAGRSGASRQTPHYGKYRGTVTDNQDPKNLGRVKAKVPEVLNEVETGWALPAFPYSGDGEGSYAVPPAGAGVWIEFEAGEVSKPIWSGAWFGDNQVPKDGSGTAATPDLKILRGAKGLHVAIDDKAETITISDGDGSNLVVVKAQQSQVRIEAKTKVIVEAPQIELVDGAAHQLVFGDDLLHYLNQLVSNFNLHMHPGEFALAVLPVTPSPPVPLFPPPTPSLLSMKVKTG
jgi:uncharacterized protein involved in type VI secretion and phage assembly